MKMNNQDRSWHVILSGAKNLCVASEILRFTQNDMVSGAKNLCVASEILRFTQNDMVSGAKNDRADGGCEW